MPGPSCPSRIAIIGAGFSGTMMAIHLRRSLPATCRILLIERSGAFARGVAYAQTDQPHMLNVRAANMSAFPDDPSHFERWIELAGQAAADELKATEAGLFATRRLYGRYLQETLQTILDTSKGDVELLSEDVVSLAPLQNGWQLQCSSGNSLEVAGVVLACGNIPSPADQDRLEINAPWAPGALEGLDAEVPVLIVGTGLTMVDLALALHAKGLRAPIHVISRRGLLPQPHAAIGAPWPTPSFSPAARRNTLLLFRAVRAELAQATTQRVGWRAVIDSLRPITAALWQGLPAAEQARFMRHVRPFWDIHRHRMAPSAAATLMALHNAGQLQIHRGRVKTIQRLSSQLADVEISTPGPGKPMHLQVQRIIYATGLRGLGSQGLPGALVKSGMAKLDCHGLGLQVTPELAICDATNRPVPNLWALGPLVLGMFWECLAVPDIRQQARLLSEQIAASPPFGSPPAALLPTAENIAATRDT